VGLEGRVGSGVPAPTLALHAPSSSSTQQGQQKEQQQQQQQQQQQRAVLQGLPHQHEGG